MDSFFYHPTATTATTMQPQPPSRTGTIETWIEGRLVRTQHHYLIVRSVIRDHQAFVPGLATITPQRRIVGMDDGLPVATTWAEQPAPAGLVVNTWVAEQWAAKGLQVPGLAQEQEVLKPAPARALQYRAQIEPTPRAAQRQIFNQPEMLVNAGWQQTSPDTTPGQYFHQPALGFGAAWTPLELDFNLGMAMDDSVNFLDLGLPTPPFSSQDLQFKNLPGVSNSPGLISFEEFKAQYPDLVDLEDSGLDISKPLSGDQGAPEKVAIDLTEDEVPAAPKPPCHLEERKRCISRAFPERKGLAWYNSFLRAPERHQRAYCKQYWPSNEEAVANVGQAISLFDSFEATRLYNLRWEAMVKNPPLVEAEDGQRPMTPEELEELLVKESRECYRPSKKPDKQPEMAGQSTVTKQAASSEPEEATKAQKQWEDATEGQLADQDMADINDRGQVSKLNVQALKLFLKKRKLPVGGKKMELVVRVQTYLDEWALVFGGGEESPEPSGDEMQIDEDDDEFSAALNAELETQRGEC